MIKNIIPLGEHILSKLVTIVPIRKDTPSYLVIHLKKCADCEFSFYFLTTGKQNIQPGNILTTALHQQSGDLIIRFRKIKRS